MAKRAVYLAREERAASKHRAGEARSKAERAKKALEDSTALVDRLYEQAGAVGHYSCAIVVVVAVLLRGRTGLVWSATQSRSFAFPSVLAIPSHGQFKGLRLPQTAVEQPSSTSSRRGWTESEECTSSRPTQI